MTTHKDVGVLCLVAHYDGYGQYIICACCAHVRPHEWRDHINAAATALAAKRDAEAAVIEAAKAWSQRQGGHVLDAGLVRAVDALLAIEGDA